MGGFAHVFNRPGVAGAVLKTAPSFSNSLMVCGNIFMAPQHPYGWRGCFQL